MKKILTLLSVLVVVTLFAGCSLLPNISPADNKINQTPVTDFFNYEDTDYLEGEVLVQVHSMDQLSTFTKQGSTVLREWPSIGWALITVPQGETTLSFVEKLRKEKGIIMAQPNMEYELTATSTAPRYDEQWGFDNINAEAGWDITTGSSNVVVAIVDTGVMVDHPEFADKTFVDPVDVTVSPFLTGVENMKDWNGHGTHVAGIAADNGATGQIAGVAWDCPIMPIRVEDNYGSIYTSYLIDAMLYLGDWAIQHEGTHRVVANMSIGGRGYNFAFKDAIDYAFQCGVLLITSAGNDSKRIISYPSAYNGVVSVAASTPYDVRTDFSTQGWWNSVAAPGIEILSTYIGYDYDTQSFVPAYAYLQGTSMASPYVCGAAALLLSKDPTLTPLEVKNQLEQTARGETFNEQLGYGILDIEALLGDLEPMAYGSLDVQTNIISSADTWIGTGVVSVFDSNNNLVGFGTTGEFGNYLFHALKPDTYTVTVSYYNLYEGIYEILSDTILVNADNTSVLNLTFQVPVDVTQELLNHYDIAVTDDYSVQYSIEITEQNFYEFITGFYTQEADTELYLLDAEDNLIAYNDDFMDRYSYIGMKLAVGNYTLIVSEWSEEPPLYCTLDIYKTTITY